MTNELITKVKKLPKFEVYRNRTPVIEIDGVSLGVEDIIKSGVISGSNIFLLGERNFGNTHIF